MKKWNVLYKKLPKDVSEVIKILLTNRNIKTKKEADAFLHPKLEDVTIDSVGIDKKQLTRALARIDSAIAKNEKIVVYGDYDVDGICGTAILWESIYRRYKNVTPYIPDRFGEGYGLSVKGIRNLLSVKDEALQRTDLDKQKPGLIITVDNGIVAYEAIAYANSLGIDVIVTDHHVREKNKKLGACTLVHTTQLCGAGVAWMLAREFTQQGLEDYLDLVILATVADLVPLTGANRTLVTFGLSILQKTRRVGLEALFAVASLQKDKIGIYEIGHIICPRLNAMGRLFSAMDSLRLICTKDRNRAFALAQDLHTTNRERQLLTEETALHAKRLAVDGYSSKIIFVHHPEYNEGIIGLVAGKLVEEFYRPSFVLSVGQSHVKGSARSIAGINIIEMIRAQSDHLLQAGGHPMAAGFTLKKEKIEDFRRALEKYAQAFADELFERELKIDMPIALSQVSFDLYEKLQELAPFGMANPEPVFLTDNVIIEAVSTVGRDKKHLKLGFQNLEGIAFGIGDRVGELRVGSKVKIAYTIAEDTWNGNNKLQLKIKDIKST